MAWAYLAVVILAAGLAIWAIALFFFWIEDLEKDIFHD